MFAKHWLLRKDAFRRLYQLIICIIIFCGNYQLWPSCGQITSQGWLQQGTTQLRPIKSGLVQDPILAVRDAPESKPLKCLQPELEILHFQDAYWENFPCSIWLKRPLHCTFLLIFTFFIALPMTCWSKEHQYLCAGSGGHISNTQWLLNCLWIHFSDNLKSVTWAFPSTCYYLK